MIHSHPLRSRVFYVTNKGTISHPSNRAKKSHQVKSTFENQSSIPNMANRFAILGVLDEQKIDSVINKELTGRQNKGTDGAKRIDQLSDNSNFN